MKAEQVLQGYSPAEQKRIVEGASKLGITSDDPSFRMMATLGRYEETMIDLQARMQAMVEAWAVLIDQKLEKTTQTAQSMHYQVVSNAVRDEMKKIKVSTSQTELTNQSLRMVSISTLCALAAAVGTFSGSITTWNVLSNMGTSQSVVVSRNDMAILEWAKSQQGKQMYQMLLKNQQVIQACQREKKTQGYCLIQVDK